MAVGSSRTCRLPLVHWRSEPSERVRPRALKTSRSCTTRRSHSSSVSRRLRFTVRETPMRRPRNVRAAAPTRESRARTACATASGAIPTSRPIA